jgi:hypothetical protein
LTRSVSAIALDIAAERTRARYLAPLIQCNCLDRDRVTDDDFGVRLGFGKDFQPNLAAEIKLGLGEVDASNRIRLTLSNIDVNVLRKFYLDSKIRPYASVDKGTLESGIDSGSSKGLRAGSIGLGVLGAEGD